MVDMHSHILYNVDDGANSIETTMLMLQQAALEDIPISLQHLTAFILYMMYLLPSF